ncbi:MAG: tRNA pseudouridine(38-40) synthase TruA [Capsulimonadaceae bacterium]
MRVIRAEKSTPQRERPGRNIRLLVEYDGTEFCGFQTQGHGERTVQSVLGDAIESVVAHPVILHAAGRTDTGVHALGQVVSFTTVGAIPIERMAIALNGRLPADLAVAVAEEAPEDFNARFSAVSRTYGYLIWTRRTRSALWGRFSYHSRRGLNLERMRDAAGLIAGTRDFGAFARSGGSPGPSTVRRVSRLSIRRLDENRVLVVMKANGFLRAMVRNIVGLLLEVGCGDLDLTDVATIRDCGRRDGNPVPPAPSCGLCLLRVDY